VHASSKLRRDADVEPKAQAGLGTGSTDWVTPPLTFS